MKVIGYDPILTAEAAARLGIELVSLDELFARADFITVHTPLTADTRGMVNAAAFAKMKKGVRVINCARGGIIDEQALADAISRRARSPAPRSTYSSRSHRRASIRCSSSTP